MLNFGKWETKIKNPKATAFQQSNIPGNNTTDERNILEEPTESQIPHPTPTFSTIFHQYRNRENPNFKNPIEIEKEKRRNFTIQEDNLQRSPKMNTTQIIKKIHEFTQIPEIGETHWKKKSRNKTGKIP